MEKVQIGQLGFCNTDMDGALKELGNFLNSGRANIVVTPNAEIAYLATKDENLRDMINNADLTVCDGSGVLLASKLIKKPLPQKIAGIELGYNFLKVLETEGKSLFLLGAAPGIADKAANNLQKDFPGLKISGTNDGFFKNPDDVIEIINKAGAEVLYVCLGAVKQEEFMYYAKDRLTTLRVMIGLGGSIDVFAGAAKRAPKIFIKLHLEWLYRIVRHPSRIGRAIRLPLYIIHILRFRG